MAYSTAQLYLRETQMLENGMEIKLPFGVGLSTFAYFLGPFHAFENKLNVYQLKDLMNGGIDVGPDFPLSKVTYSCSGIVVNPVPVSLIGRVCVLRENLDRKN